MSRSRAAYRQAVDACEIPTWYRRAAGDGDPTGFARLAGIAWDQRVNTGDAKRAVEALHLFRLAAQGGHAPAMMAVAGQTDDPDERELWQRRAAEEHERLDHLTGPDGPEPFGAHMHTPVTTVTITTGLAPFVRQVVDRATETDMMRHVRLGMLFVGNGDRALQLWADTSSEAIQALGRLDLDTLPPGRLYWRQADRSWQMLG